MGPFMKGVLGFVGCAGICGAAYAIGKHVGREETLKEVELEEKRMAVQAQTKPAPPVQQPEPSEETKEISVPEQPVQPTAVERVRKTHGFKNKLFGGIGAVKDLLSNADNKQLTMTVEDGDLVARLSQKGG